MEKFIQRVFLVLFSVAIGVAVYTYIISILTDSIESNLDVFTTSPDSTPNTSTINWMD